MDTCSLAIVAPGSSCSHCPVNKGATSSSLNGHLQPSLRGIMMRKRFQRGQTIWREGDDLELVGIIVSGIVKLIKMHPDGRQQIVQLVFPPDLLGNPFVSEYLTSAEAASEVELCFFPRKKIEDIVSQYPELGRTLMVKFLKDLDAAHRRIFWLGQMSAKEKVLHLLLELSRRRELMLRTQRQSTTEIVTFVLPLTRGEIGEYLGLTIETVSRQVTQLKVSGVIRILERQIIQICRPASVPSLTNVALV